MPYLQMALELQPLFGDLPDDALQLHAILELLLLLLAITAPGDDKYIINN